MNLITTVATDQQQILRDISTLYIGGQPFEADLTYGSGGFWWGMDYEPAYTNDPDPWSPAKYHEDIRDLTLPNNYFRSVVVDLPFIHAHGKESVMGRRFSSYPSQRELDDLHHETARELSRVLVPGGVVAWKCQDIIESGKQVWNHLRIHYHCGQLDLYAEDLFILATGRKPVIGWNQHTQKHARRTHSYFWVFKKASK